jgi:hypothetical protein
MAFTETDLLADISQEELDGIGKELVELGGENPIEATIAEQVQKVEDYTLRWAVPELRLKRLTRPLVLWELYKRLGAIPDKRQTAYDEAMKELKEIRDGKFPDLAIQDPAPDGSPGSTAAWGSECQL